MLVSLTEYAKIVNKDPSTVRYKCIKGLMTTAVKIGRNWVIDSGEAWSDNRKKTRNNGDSFKGSTVDETEILS